MKRNRVAKMCLAVGLLAFSVGSLGQTYPSKPVKVIVGISPGTGNDGSARMISRGLTTGLGQPFVVENRLGASGLIAAAYVAKAPADGYTILWGSASFTSAVAITRDLPFDRALAFAGVTPVAESPLVLVVSRAKGIQSVQELIRAAKSSSRSFSFASGGVGTGTHIAAEKLRLASGFDALHVPYKGTSEAVADLLAGRVDFTYTSTSQAVPLVAAGKLVALAMSSKRSSKFPNVMTIEESGVENATYSSWYGMLVPSKTSRAVVNYLYRETVKLLGTQEMKDQMAKVGIEPFSMTPEEFDTFLRKDLEEQDRIVKALGLKQQ